MKCKLFLYLFLGVVLCPNVAANTEVLLRENSIRSAMIYNLVDYVTWPESIDNKDVKLCVFGNNALASSLLFLHDKKTAKGRMLVIKVSDINVLSQCWILFVAYNEQSKFLNALAAITTKPLLTIGDHKTFTEQGGMIGFDSESNRVKLKINLAAIHLSGLALSSQILKIATIIGSSHD